MNQPLEWKALWDAMDANPDAWIPTTEAMYWQMLNVLPPLKMIKEGLGESFLVGEPLRHSPDGAVYACFTKIGDTYKARNLTLNQYMEGYGYIPAKELG